MQLSIPCVDALEKEFAGHERQAFLSCSLILDGQWVSEAHSLQDSGPVTCFQLPSGHFSQVAPVYPARHRQSPRLLDAASDVEWFQHEVHVSRVEAATTSEYLSLSQSMHMWPISYVPLSQGSHILFISTCPRVHSVH